MMGSRSGKRPPRGSVSGRKIDAGILRVVLQRYVLSTRGLVMPSEPALGRLADILEGWRQHYAAEENLGGPLREAHKRARRALHQAQMQLREIGRINRSYANAPGARPVWLMARIGAIDAAIEMIEERILLPTSIFEHPSIGAERGWLWLADVLVEDLKIALRSTNPGYAPGIGHQGPIARYISAIAPLLTGERPPAASVATQLKRRMGKTRTG